MKLICNFIQSFLIFFFTISIFSQNSDHVSGELLIQLKKNARVNRLIQSTSQIDLQLKEVISDYMKIYLFSFNQAKAGDDEALEILKNNSNVQTCQFNHYVQLRAGNKIQTQNNLSTPFSKFPNDPSFSQQWSLHNTGQGGGTPDADIDAPEAWDLTTGGITALGDTIVVAVVDGGFDLNHQDLNFWKNWKEIPGNNIDDDGNGYIDDVNGWNAYNNNGTITSSSHGTHVSGIAGARGNNNIGVSGVNWNVKVMSIQGSSGTESVVLKAYNYCLTQRKRYNETNGQFGAFVVVTNASFGVDYGQPSQYPLWCAMYDSLGAFGILSCGATANLNINVDVQGDIPTACPSDWLISVTNTTNTDQKNSGAAYGLTTIDLGAPGTNVYSTVPNNSYSNMTGTSMATPTVAGAVALMFGGANNGLMQTYKSNPKTGALIFKQFLLSSTDTVSDLIGKTVTGGRLNVFKALLKIVTPPDTVPPTQVTDLSVVNPTSNSLTLNWTAPCDTTRNGVVAYNIRYSVNPIVTLNDFNNATPVNFTGQISPCGQQQTFNIDSLSFNTIYYFALRSSDMWGNQSLMSNVANETTWSAPKISVSKDSIHYSVQSNQTFSDSVIITNSSLNNSTLNYKIEFANSIFPLNSFSQSLITLHTKEIKSDNKELPEINFGSSIDGYGGPDAFGYKWIDSDEPNGPQYVWNDISTSGTQVTNWIAIGTYTSTDEGYFGPVNLNFNFKFYGQIQNQIYFSTNGFLTFVPIASATYTNSQLPSSVTPNGLIVPFWDDLDGKTTGKVFYKLESDKLIVQYQNWQRYSSGSDLTFQIILYSNGKIEYYYKSMTGTLNSASVGIENQTGTIGLQTAFNANYIKNNLAIRYSSLPDWLNTQNNSGTIYKGNSVAVKLNFSSNNLDSGLYSMDMLIKNNDPQKPVVKIPIKMNVKGSVPVELISFIVNQKNNLVSLNWVTATETNNKGFEIQKSVISSQMLREINNNLEWINIGFVNGRGTTTEKQNYSFTDKILTGDKFAYRLKQIDFDGTTKYSNVIEVWVSKPKEYSLEQNHPNPFNPVTKINYAIANRQHTTLKIIDILGNEIATLVDEVKEPGFYEIEFSSQLIHTTKSAISSGVYFYQLRVGNFVSTKKFVLLK